LGGEKVIGLGVGEKEEVDSIILGSTWRRTSSGEEGVEMGDREEITDEWSRRKGNVRKKIRNRTGGTQRLTRVTLNRPHWERAALSGKYYSLHSKIQGV
jgi:hypothetical protein